MRVAVAASLILSVAVLLLVGCGGRQAVPVPYDTVWVSRAASDSLGLEAFRRLPSPTAAARRERARACLVRADRARGVAPRVRQLCTAAGLTPDDPVIWFRLAEDTFGLGDTRRALDYLDRAEAAILVRDAEDRRDLRRRLAQARAWLHRHRGRWAEAHAWADSAARYAPEERETKMLQGLTRANHGDLRGAFNIAREIERLHFFRFEWRWIRGMAELARGSVDNAYHWLRDARPDGPWSARFYRDLAQVCEQVGNLGEARRFHGYSLAALDLEPGLCGEPVEVAIPRAEGGADRVPIWWSLGRLSVAGSRLGAALAAVDSFRVERPPAGRGIWADTAQDLLSDCIRHGLDELRCRRERGLLYAEMGFAELALADLRRVVADLESRDEIEPEIFALYGHLLNGDRKYQQALSYLQKAVDVRPDLARAWSALGFNLLMTAQGAAGETALERALALDPDLPEAWYNLGLSHYYAHRWGDAAAALERALELAPDNPDILPLLQQSRGRARRAVRAEEETP